MSTDEAMVIAEEAGLDLVLVSPDANPPVCRIMNYSKFKYENEKKARETRKKAAASRVEVKELKMRYNIDIHDYGVRLRAAQKFLGAGDRVKVICQFRGRENEFRDLGRDMFMRFVDDVGADLCNLDGSPSMEGNRMVMLLSPVKEKRAVAQDGPSRRKKLTRKEKEAMSAEARANGSAADDEDDEYDDEEGDWDEDDDDEGSWDEDDRTTGRTRRRRRRRRSWCSPRRTDEGDGMIHELGARYYYLPWVLIRTTRDTTCLQSFGIAISTNPAGRTNHLASRARRPRLLAMCRVLHRRFHPPRRSRRRRQPDAFVVSFFSLTPRVWAPPGGPPRREPRPGTRNP